MVQALYGNGANSIWEHSLLDPSSSVSGKRKANPQDKVQYVWFFFPPQFSQVTCDIRKWSVTARNQASVSYLRNFKKNQTNQANTQQKQMSSVSTV